LAVRPRFWFANLQANLIDTLFGASIVTLLWLHNHDTIIQAILVAIFAIWLVVIKPRSKQRFMIIQARLTLFISLVALFSVAYAMPAVLVVAICWVIGYATARHVFSSYNNEPDRVFLTLIWSLVVAELGWLGYHWTVAYGLNDSFKLPQIAVVITLVGFIMSKAYALYHHSENGKIDMKVLRWPLLFVILTLCILLIRFNGLNPT
jgi:multisubunit Na+/H+ antiporter MnhF subunit